MNKPRSPDNSEQGKENNEFSYTSSQTTKILDFSHLFDNQRRFFEQLYTLPVLQPYQRYWKIHPSPEMDIELTKQALSTASSGEAHMLRFLAGIWLGSNTFEFDILDALKFLGTPESEFIQSWVNDPYFP